MPLALPRNRRPHALVSALVVISGVTLAGRAAAQQATARLEYTRAPGAEACPDEVELHGAVATRLGYDPFEPEAATTITTTIARAGRGLRARIEIRDSAGHVTGARDLESSRRDCGEIASAAALAISIAIDPLAFAHPAPLPPPPPPVLPPALLPAPPAPQPPPPPLRVVYVQIPAPLAARPPLSPRRGRVHRVAFRASLGALVSLGAGPALAVGFSASAGLRWQAFSLELEGRADLPSSITAPSGHGRVAASLLAGSLVPCAHVTLMAFCALATAGALHGQGYDVAVPNEASGPFLAAGARVALEIPLAAFLAFDVHADGIGTILGTTLRLNDAGVWSSPVVSGAVGAAIRGEFR